MNNEHNEILQSPEMEPRYTTAAELLQLRAELDIELASFNNHVAKVWETRNKNFTVVKPGVNEAGEPIMVPVHQPGDELYDVDPSYNTTLIHDAVDLRKGGTLEYGEEGEQYGDKESDSDEVRARNKEYRLDVKDTAQKHGFVSDHPGKSVSETDQDYAITESAFEKIEGPVGAIIIPGAASISNVARNYNALRDIHEGRVETDTIILAGCDRPTGASEQATIQRVMRPEIGVGETEIESMKRAMIDIIGHDPNAEIIEPFSPDPEYYEVSYGEGLVATSWKAKALVDGKEITIIAVSAPDDPNRPGRKPNSLTRANTEETYMAAADFLPADNNKVVISSHDAWGPTQKYKAVKSIGLPLGKEIYLSNAFYDFRITEGEEGEDIFEAEKLVNEFAKYHGELAQLILEVDKKLAELSPEEILKQFLQPVPNMDELRELKKASGYAHIEVDTDNELYDDPVVPLDRYSIANRAFYSRDSDFIQAVQGVPERVVTRKTVAEKLAFVNRMLQSAPVANAMRTLFGEDIELYVEEGVRSLELQQDLHDTHFPDHIRKQHPDWTEEQVAAERSTVIAKANESSPHAASATDTVLRAMQETLDYVEGAKLHFAHTDGNTGEIIYPDYFENTESEDEMAKMAREILYNAMTGRAFGVDTEFTPNPSEYFHWDYGNKLWALSRGKGQKALYGSVHSTTTSETN